MDLLPIVVVIVFFQVFVIKQPLPALADILFGCVLVVVGLSLFVQGLETGLFPIGETLADALARKGSVFWLLLFSFGLGFTTTIAEPSLMAVAYKANEVSAGTIDKWGLRIVVAIGVAIGIALGCFRIVSGTPLYLYILGGYLVVVI